MSTTKESYGLFCTFNAIFPQDFSRMYTVHETVENAKKHAESLRGYYHTFHIIHDNKIIWDAYYDMETGDLVWVECTSAETESPFR